MNKIRLAGWLAVGGLLGAALLAPSAALATDLHTSSRGPHDDGFRAAPRTARGSSSARATWSGTSC